MPDDLSATLERPAVARPRRPSLPTLRQIWFQLHWLIGITAGTVLIVIGLTGAALSFREEWLDLLNPGVRHVQPRPEAMLTPARLTDAVAPFLQGRRIANITVFSEPGAAARIGFAPPPGQRKGETVYADPYTGALQPPLRGADTFEWVESLHRWLLLPRETGRGVAGTLACCLLVMALSGLYLRWPRRPLSWRTWLTFDVRLRGRSFLWGLHSVLGTWVLLAYLVSTGSGIYWAFDLVRDNVDGWAGGRMGRDAPAAGAKEPRGKGGEGRKKIGEGKAGAGKQGDPRAGLTADLGPAWNTFQQQAGIWGSATLRVPDKPGQAVQISWLSADAPHERARNRMALQTQTGKVTLDERFERQAAGQRFLAAIYPLHMGSYFGLAGRIVMTIGALSLPMFAVTGWMLYLKRRTQKKAVRAERALLAGAVPPSQAAPVDTLLLAYASQSGHAERIAVQSAVALRRAGLQVTVLAIDQLTPAQLREHRRALLVASTFGEGEAPDGARRFARLLRQELASCAGLRYGLLALGDRNYAQFCGFGHALEHDLRRLGAVPLFSMIEVDNGDPEAIGRWSQALGRLAGATEAAAVAAFAADLPLAQEQASYDSWQLVKRELLNPGSQGGPLYEVSLAGHGDAHWLPGALVDVLPRHAADAVAAFLQMAGLDGTAQVTHGGRQRSLAEALARSELPANGSRFASPQACADTLHALAPRSYSVASLPRDGLLQLLVRQERHAGGLGLASGWLTAHAPAGGEIELRLLDNPSFAPVDDAPAILIGNGSGLAGLRAHLRNRVEAGERRNWLLFGERERARDAICAAEIDGWLAAGYLQRLDLVYSRDPAGRVYVQDRLRDAHEDLRTWVAQGAVLYVCGSLKGMAAGVDAALDEVLGGGVLEDLIAAGRYRRDVY